MGHKSTPGATESALVSFEATVVGQSTLDCESCAAINNANLDATRGPCRTYGSGLIIDDDAALLCDADNIQQAVSKLQRRFHVVAGAQPELGLKDGVPVVALEIIDPDRGLYKDLRGKVLGELPLDAPIPTGYVCLEPAWRQYDGAGPVPIVEWDNGVIQVVTPLIFKEETFQWVQRCTTHRMTAVCVMRHRLLCVMRNRLLCV